MKASDYCQDSLDVILQVLKFEPLKIGVLDILELSHMNMGLDTGNLSSGVLFV